MSGDESLEDRLDGMPLLSVVAFASRCARRSQLHTRSLPNEQYAAIDAAIVASERFAKGEIGVGSGSCAEAASVVARGISDPRSAHAAQAAVNAAQAAYFASTATIDEATEADIANAARTVVRFAVLAAAGSATDAIASDLERLVAFNSGLPSKMGRAIDPSELGPLGPLWPQGEPESPRNSLEPEAILRDNQESSPLTFYIDAGEFSDLEIADFLSRFSDLYRSVGGDALIIDRVEMLDPSTVLTPEEA